MTPILGTSGSYLGNIVLGQLLHDPVVNDIIGFSQSVIANKVLNISVISSLTFSQAGIAHRIQNLSITSTLSLSQDEAQSTIRRLFATLALSQVVVVNSVFNRSLTQTLPLVQAESKSAIFNRSLASLWSPYQGKQTTVNMQGLQITIPATVLTKVNGYVSYEVPGYVLLLQKPDFGDSEGGLDKVVEHRTVSGTLYTHVRTTRSRALKYKFVISRAKYEESRQFVLDNLSVPMYMHNWKGEIWYGFITNNPFKLTTRGRAVPCNREDYEMDVEFEGVRIH